MAQRDDESQRRSRAFMRFNFKLAPQALSPRAHACQTVTASFAQHVEPATVIAELQEYTMPVHLEFNLGLSAPGMAHRVINGFFENQKNLTAKVSAYSKVTLGIRKAKPKIDSTRGKNITRKVAHALGQIT